MFVPAKCTQCGAALLVDDSKDTAVCEYCKTPFVPAKGIVNVAADTVHLNAHTIHVTQGKDDDDFDIVAGSLRSYRGSHIDVQIPDGVVEIDPGAFSGMTALRSVTFPESVRQIEGPRLNLDGAFAGCTSLEKIVLPEGIECIEECAFRNCKNLTQINIPDGVDIHTYAFGNSYEYGCPNLTSVDISDKKLLETSPSLFLYTGYKKEAYDRFNKLHIDAYNASASKAALTKKDAKSQGNNRDVLRSVLIFVLSAVVILAILFSGPLKSSVTNTKQTAVEILYANNESNLSKHVKPSRNVALVDNIIMVHEITNSWGFVSAVLDDLHIDLGETSGEVKQNVIEMGGEVTIQAVYENAELEVFIMYDRYSEALSMSIIEVEE